MHAPARSGLSDNAASALAYFTFIPAIVFLMTPRYSTSSYVRFHSWQSIFLCVAAFLVNVFLDMLTLMTLFMALFGWLARIVLVLWILLWVLCVIQALNGKRFRLPLIGQMAEKLSAQ